MEDEEEGRQATSNESTKAAVRAARRQSGSVKRAGWGHKQVGWQVVGSRRVSAAGRASTGLISETRVVSFPECA